MDTTPNSNLKAPQTPQTSASSLKQPPTSQSIRLDDGPKLILIDKGRVIDEIKLNDYDTRTIKTHQGEIISCLMEATTYYRKKK